MRLKIGDKIGFIDKPHMGEWEVMSLDKGGGEGAMIRCIKKATGYKVGHSLHYHPVFNDNKHYLIVETFTLEN